MFNIFLFILLAIIAVFAVEVFFFKGENLCKNSFIGTWFCKCPTDSFGDPDGKCWSCPVKNGTPTDRTLDAVTSDTACSGKCPSLYGAQSFEDATSNVCWSCPSSHPTRTIYSVDSDKACQAVDCASLYKDHDGYTTPSMDITTGKCWSCPTSSPIRSYDSVTSATACQKGILDGVTSAKIWGNINASATKNGGMTFSATEVNKVL